jgi:Tfp pilus assembly protein PilX
MAGPIARRLRGEGGFALPTVLLMLLAAFAVVSVGVIASINTQRGAVRDQGTKSAVQLAETGVHQALLHFNRIEASPTNACSPVSSGGPDLNGWCPAVPASDTAGGSYAYQVRVCDSTGACPPAAGRPPYQLEVVGSGTRGDAARRVYVRGHSVSGQSIFADYQVKAGEGITLDSNARIHAGAATNGDIVLSSNAKQCGNASVGIGREMQQAGDNSYFNDPECTSPETVVNQQEIFLPPVNQGDIAEADKNDNWRFFDEDHVSGNKENACWNGIKADGTPGTCGTRHLDINTNTTLTLSPSKPYSFCKLTMSSNTSLFVSRGHTGVIYFDSPENCGYPSGTVQIEMASNTRISSNDGSPVQILVVGSSDRQTLLHLSSNTDINTACQQNFVVYAPLSDVVLNSNSTYCGALAGKTLHLDSNADVRTNGLSQGFYVPNTAAHYMIDRFIECTAATASPANTGC